MNTMAEVRRSAGDATGPREPRRRSLRWGRRLGGLLTAASAAALAVIPAALPRATPPSSASAPLDRPDIVIVLTDDQRMETVSPEGMPRLWTDVREQGRMYPNASVPTSLCCPSRASILTGFYAHHTRVFSNGMPYGGWTLFHERGWEDHTIATALQAAGYDTSLVGKYLNGPFPAALEAGYVPPGWDHLISYTAGGDHLYNYSLNDGTTYGADPEDYSTDVLAGYGKRFIRNAPADKPLFLLLATTGPHRPFTPAPRDIGLWHGRLPSYDPPAVSEDVSDKPPWVRRLPMPDQAQIDEDLASAQEAVMSIDDAVGGLLDTLEATGRLDNTLFIFLTDNGLLHGEHRLMAKNLPYRWATSIPLLVRWDGHVTPDSTDSRLALNVDLAQTISDATGLALTTDGLDLLGGVERSGFPLEGAPWIPGSSPPKHPAYCGYRTHRWMYAEYATGNRELYDYRNDPQELDNAAYLPADQPVVRRMRALAMQTCRPTPPGFAWSEGGGGHPAKARTGR